MSNKPWHKLNSIDHELRRLFPPSMGSPPVQLIIKKISGFELFNTRPYHNYETFSDGWRIEVPGSFVVEAEDLDDAVRELKNKLEQDIE